MSVPKGRERGGEPVRDGAGGGGSPDLHGAKRRKVGDTPGGAEGHPGRARGFTPLSPSPQGRHKSERSEYDARVRDVEGAKQSAERTERKRSPEQPGPEGEARRG